MPGSGRLIVLDGLDGSGKSTQVRLLAEALRGRGLEVVTVRDPGGTALGEQVRRWLLSPTSGEVSARAEVLLYMASRAELTARIIRPALEGGKVVVADRFYSASVAYQGVGRGLGVAPVVELARFACDGVVPDLTIILDMDPMDALRRRGDAPLDRIESRAIAYHRRVREGFRQLADEGGEKVRLIPADDTIEAVHRRILGEVERVL